MPLVPGICTQCGATLSADNTKECMICPYCGTPFIVEKAINNFHNTYNISNSVVNINGSIKNDFVIRAGVLEKYTGSATVVTIPDNIVAIGEYAFNQCYGISEILIPKGVRVIGGGAFQSCKFLKKITLPNSLEEVGGHAFSGCDSLRDIFLPDSLQVIGWRAFGCSNLAKVRLPNNNCDPSRVNEECFGFAEIREADVPNKSWFRVLDGTPFQKKYVEELVRKERLERRRQSLCQYCGGTFGGIFGSKCKNCGKYKDY